jgi:hypothetical protein
MFVYIYVCLCKDLLKLFELFINLFLKYVDILDYKIKSFNKNYTLYIILYLLPL